MYNFHTKKGQKNTDYLAERHLPQKLIRHGACKKLAGDLAERFWPDSLLLLRGIVRAQFSFEHMITFSSGTSARH
jgi:hypothetical protein